MTNPPRRWRSIGGPRDPGPSPDPRERTGSGSDAGEEAPSEETHRYAVPPHLTGTLSGVSPGPAPTTNAVPRSVQADTFRMLLARHEPGSETQCRCGQPLGEETGLCWYGRSALAGLTQLLAEEDAAGDQPAT